MLNKKVILIAACAIFAGTSLMAAPASAQWRHRGGDAAGAAVAGGILGLATGAMIGAAASQAAPPPAADAEYVAYCARKYRSFDPASGTFLARDGNRYQCQMP